MPHNNTHLTAYNPGLELVVTYFVLFAGNILMLYLAYSFFPENVVLGTLTISKTWAMLHSMGVLALVDTLAIPLFYEYERMRDKSITAIEWLTSYFVLNFIAIWLIARFAEQFGLGITSWVVAAGMALTLVVVQGLDMISIETSPKQKKITTKTRRL